MSTLSEDVFGQYKVKNAEEFMMLGVGQPSPTILKNALQFINYNINSNYDNIDVLQYGLKQGFKSFQNLVVKLMKDYTHTKIDSDSIYMTNGISHSVMMLSTFLKNKLGYNTIYVEDLTYFIMINIFKDLDFNIKSFNLNDLEKLKVDLQQNPKSIIYLIPFCNNPTGLTMTQTQLENFIEIIQKDTIVLSDETYQFLHFNSNPFTISNKSLSYYNSNIISLGTFSKILVPGVRLGWIYSTYKFADGMTLNNWLDNTGFMDSGGSVNPIMAYMITKNILNNYESYKEILNNIIKDLQNKSDYVCKVLNKYPDYFEVIKPNGGYFVFVRNNLNKSIKSKELWNLATTHCQFGFHEGNKFSINKSHDDWFRISVSYYSFDDFKNYFDDRIQKLLKFVDNFQYNISVFGNGKLGKLIKTNLINQNISIGQIDRNFNKKDFGKVIIDVTSPEGTMVLIDKFKYYGILPKLIIGTTGHTKEQIEKITEYSKLAPVIYCANFSNGIQNLIKMIRCLTFKILKIEIVDIHHIHKKDSPSGTAKLLQKELKNIYNDIDINIISYREGTIIGFHKIVLIGLNESITLEHNANSRDIFADGCINLISKIECKENGFYEYL